MKIGALVNAVVVMLLALGVSAWSVWANPSDLALESEEWTYEAGASFDEDLSPSEAMTFVRNGRDSLVLLPGSDAEVQWDEENKHVDVLLKEGGVLFATKANDFSVSVHTASVRVDSQESLAYVERDSSGDVTVYGLNHPSLITFTENGDALNSLFVPNGMMITVQESKVTSTLSRLRLTKLSKEFRASEWSSEDFSESVAAAWSDSKLRYTQSSVAYSQSLQLDPQFGPVQSGLGAKLYGAFDQFRELATVVPTAEARLEETQKNNMLNYAMSNLLFSKVSEGEAWLSDWEAENHDLNDLEDLYSDLFFVLPGDELYAVKSAVIELTFAQENTLSSLRRQFLEIESLVSRGESVDAQDALQRYQLSLSAALESGIFDDSNMLGDLSREYLLVELMIKENPDFYIIESAEMLSQMEEKILSLAGDDTDLAEERQAFVLSKIQFLTRLFEFVMDRRLSVDEATDLANELLYDAQTYMVLIPSNVAIRDWYESELDKAELAIAFINSPEFYSYSSFEEGLSAFAVKEQDLEDLQAYIQQIRDGNGDQIGSSITLDEALEEVRSAFTLNAITYAAAESQGDAAYRLFDIIGGKLDVYTFEASYDREGGLLYDLVIEDQIRFSTGILLEDLRDVIEQALKETPLEDDSVESDQVTNGSSLTEDLAIHQVEEAFEDAGLNSNDFDFEVISIDENHFRFEGEITRYSIPVYGEYLLEEDKVQEVSWIYIDDEQTLPDMSLTQMEGAIEAVYAALSS